MRVQDYPVPAPPWSIGIRFKLSAAFVAFALLATAFAGAAIVIQLDTIERAASWEAGRLADTVYNDDSGNEVGLTILDGRPRTFIEQSETHPKGIRQITQIYDALLAAERNHLALFVLAAVGCVLVSGVLGLRLARQLAGRIDALEAGVRAVADGNYDASLPVRGDDEIDRVSAGFNTMVRALKDNRDQLLDYALHLEDKIEDRVAALRDSEARMSYLAQYDSLTGLPNRHLFRDRLAQAMARADRDQQPMALMFIDLDHFKQINDSLGHAVGDQVLKAFAQRLRDSVREMDTIARLGGDEFTIILERLADPVHAIGVAERIHASLAQPLVLAERELTVSASIGIALHAFGVSDSDRLLQAADIAMYSAKKAGRNTHALFAPEMAVQVSERATMEAQLRLALERAELELHYQPKLALDSGRVVGVEALLRWNSPELGPVSPARFIPLAEEMGLIVPIGEWVLRSACAQGMAWQLQGLAPLTMAVNLSPRQLRDPTLIDKISGALRETGFPARLLELELTEGLIMDNVAGNQGTLAAIRDLGVSLSIDDFGTGYSSLAYLTQLPVQTLKIDRSFITALDDGLNARTLVATIVTLAHSLKLKVVAEGVETQAQQDLLRQLRCDQIQGYLFSRPLTADALAALVRLHMASSPAVIRSRQGDAQAALSTPSLCIAT